MGVYIDGVGKISSGQPGITDIKSTVPSSKLRRCCRYTKLAASCADLALQDCSGYSDLSPYRIGTVVSTGYGSSEYYIQFADEVVQDDPQICSPSVFAQTVPNTCLGQICIINGFKGAGTLLRGGDPLEYSSLLLKLGKADMILCGQVEEWSDELIASFGDNEACKGVRFAEGSAFAVLRTTVTDKTYCEVISSSSVNLGFNPLLEKNDSVTGMIAEALKGYDDEVIYTTANGTWFDERELEAVKRAMGDVVCISPKETYGEALGSSFMLSVVQAAVDLRDRKYKSAVVTGFDMSGNYMAVRLSAL